MSTTYENVFREKWTSYVMYVKDLRSTLPWPPEMEPRGVRDTSTRISGLDLNISLFQGGRGLYLVRLSLGRRLVNLLPALVVQRANALARYGRISLLIPRASEL